MYPEILSRFSWNIHLDTKKVWMRGDRILPKRFRIQKYVEIDYSEIVSISIEYTYKNSSGQSIRSWFYGPRWSKKRYLVFETYRFKKRRLHVSHYTNMTLAKIIDDIAERCEAGGKKYDGRRSLQIMKK